MEPIDDELKKGLASEPLTRNGFSDALKKRIGERLDEREAKSRRWLPWFSAVSASLVAASLFLYVGWMNSQGHLPDVLPGKQEESIAATPAQQTEGQPEVEIRSAVLIGLRADHSPIAGVPEYSSYRTLLLAGNQGKLQKVAEGDGILMPYKTEFMKIVPQNQTGTTEPSWVLNASVASSSNKLRTAAPRPAVSLKVSEKLLFAGNRYISVSQTVRKNEQGKEVPYDYVWVKEIQDVVQSPSKLTMQPASEPHVSLKKLYGDSVQPDLNAVAAGKPLFSYEEAAKVPQDDLGESWAIIRKQGQWVPQLALYGSKDAYRYQLSDVSLTLPDSVVSYDRLAVGWNEIRSVRADAKDAFSSPRNELVGIVSDDEIAVYPFDGTMGRKPLATVPLAPNESVVMIQWAVDEPFIGMWKDSGKKLLSY